MEGEHITMQCIFSVWCPTESESLEYYEQKSYHPKVLEKRAIGNKLCKRSYRLNLTTGTPQYSSIMYLHAGE